MEPRIPLRLPFNIAFPTWTFSIWSLLLSGCAADLAYTPKSTIVNSSSNGTAIGIQNQTAATLIGGRVIFKSSDFYTLFNPQPTTKCAGDANTYYDPLALNAFGTPQVLIPNLLDTSTTIRPSFIKNVGVDLTDSNIYLATNKAFSCSYGKSSLVPLPSNCATFDNIDDTFVSVATASDKTLLVGGAPTQNPYSLPSGNQIIRASALLKPYVVILPPAELNLGKVVFIEKTDASTNPVTVKTTGTDTVIDSITAATTITTQFGYLGFTATARVGLIPPYYWAPNTITQDNLTFANSPYTVNALTSDRHLNVDTTNGDVTLTLPTALSSAGHFLSIRKTDTLNNNITIALNGIDEIKDQYANTFALSTYILSNKEPELVLLSVYDGSTYYWTTQNPEPISASKPYPIVAGNQIVLVDATNSELTLQLPSATANPGKNIIVQRLDVTSNLVTLKPVSSETLIDLTTPSTTLTSSNPLVTLVSTLTAVNSAVYYWKVITGVTYQATSGYNTGYYTTFDPACVQGGPILSTDPLVNSTLVGGAYFDIDRSQLGPNENLLLNLTFFPLDSSNTHLNKTAYSLQESPIIKIHLVKTGQSGDTIRSITQPRILSYGSTDQFPQAAEKIAIIGSPTGQIQEQQIFIPISIDPGIDRIHVQRHSGNIIFIDATLFRMGYR